jgi:hypothetical protein
LHPDAVLIAVNRLVFKETSENAEENKFEIVQIVTSFRNVFETKHLLFVRKFAR